MIYIQVSVPVTDTTIREILIARMGDNGYEGFEEQETGLQAFIPEGKFDEEELKSLLEAYQLSYSQTRIEEKNWNEEWEKNFEPVVVGTFCAVRASFHAPVTGVKHDLLITPKMSFGTGHHATTYMMLEAMGTLDFTGRRVLDFGTGTGVLAILAEKLGASEVLALDHDDWCIENAGENVTENNCFRISVKKLDKIPSGTGFDIILANINKNVILQELQAIGQQLTPGGVILLSGLLHDDAQDIENEAVRNGFSLVGRVDRGNWICLRLERK
ncbi:50S ribosomal protein L11 methyltransferase [Flavitalea flava]